MDLSIIIVSWNVKNLLRKCLESIYRETKNLKFEVFVVDNYSQDKTVEMIKTDFPRVNLIANQENAGFAQANNQAIHQAKGDFILLLNPDTEILENALEKMVDFMKSHSDAGVAGCQFLNSDKSLQPSVRRFPTFSSMSLIMLKLHRLFPKSNPIKYYLANDFNYSKTQEVDQVMGAFFMIKYEVIKKVGLLDKNFYIWFEEVDYCQRAKKNGWKIYYTPEAKIIHRFAQSFQQVTGLRKQLIFNHSLIYYFKKHKPFIEYLCLLFLHPLSLFLALIRQFFRSKKT